MVEPALWIDFQLIGLYLIGLATLAGLGTWPKRFWVWDSKDDDRLGWLRGPEDRRLGTLTGQTRAPLQCSDPPGFEQCPMQSLPFRLPRIRVRQEAGLHQEAAQVQAPERCAFAVKSRFSGGSANCVAGHREAHSSRHFPVLFIPSCRCGSRRQERLPAGDARSRVPPQEVCQQPALIGQRASQAPAYRRRPCLPPTDTLFSFLLSTWMHRRCQVERGLRSADRFATRAGSPPLLQQLRRDHMEADTSP